MMEAFVYCWTDHKTNMLYIGSHKGSIQKEAMSIMKRGVGKGKKVSPETKEKMSLARKKYWEDRIIKAGG